MIIVKTVFLAASVGLGAFPSHNHEEMTMNLDRPVQIPTARPSAGSQSSGGSTKYSETSAMVLSLMNAPPEAWRSDKLRERALELLESDGLYYMEREQLEAIEAITSYFSGESSLSDLAQRHWQFLHECKTTLPMKMIVQALDSELASIATEYATLSAADRSAHEQRVEQQLDALMLIICQTTHVERDRTLSGYDSPKITPRSPALVSDTHKRVFNDTMERTLECLPMEPKAAVPFSSLMRLYMHNLLAEDGLDVEIARRYVLKFPFEALNDDRITGVALKGSVDEVSAFVENEWKPMILEFCIGTDTVDLVPHALSGLDSLVLHHRALAARHPEEAALYRADYLYNTIGAANQFLDAFPYALANKFDSDMGGIHPAHRIAVLLCEGPLVRLQSMRQLVDRIEDESRRDLMKVSLSELAGLEDDLRQRLIEGNYEVHAPILVSK